MRMLRVKPKACTIDTRGRNMILWPSSTAQLSPEGSVWPSSSVSVNQGMPCFASCHADWATICRHCRCELPSQQPWFSSEIFSSVGSSSQWVLSLLPNHMNVSWGSCVRFVQRRWGLCVKTDAESQVAQEIKMWFHFLWRPEGLKSQKIDLTLALGLLVHV